MKKNAFIVLETVVDEGQTGYRYKLVGTNHTREEQYVGSKVYGSADACVKQAMQLAENVDFLEGRESSVQRRAG
ncbi:MAG: hypothetical protein JOZ43_01595 [Acidobacteriales bacterium]|nr:hypothetical protein [Terriglobales bacterium]